MHVITSQSYACTVQVHAGSVRIQHSATAVTAEDVQR
jgi:hypothetical protein